MAKLGMPSVNIAFIEAGIEAIERSQRGICGSSARRTAGYHHKIAD